MVEYNNIKLLVFHLNKCKIEDDHVKSFTNKIINHSFNTFNKYMMQFCFDFCTNRALFSYVIPFRYYCTNTNSKKYKCNCDKLFSCYHNNIYIYCIINYPIKHLNWLWKHFDFPQNNERFYSLTKSIYCKFNKNNCKLKWLYDNDCYLPTYVKAILYFKNKKMYYKKLIN